MAYEAKNFNHLLGISGLSEQLLKNHFTLYQGYVNNFNKLDEDWAGNLMACGFMNCILEI